MTILKIYTHQHPRFVSMDSAGSKRRFSRIDPPPSQDAGVEATNHLENSASIEQDRRVAIEPVTDGVNSLRVSQPWWDAFKNPDRTTPMEPLRLGQGPEVSDFAFSQLKDWYGLAEDVAVVQCTSDNGLKKTLITSTPGRTLDELITRNPGDILYIDGRRVNDPTQEKVYGVMSVNIVPAGCKGLSNLGNTCYMNSALQCISHVNELVAYFLSGHFEKDVNPSNPIGYGGNVARVFADLLKDLYGNSDEYRVSPFQFKATIGHYNRAFAGYFQQDSQEFFSWLLDSLHEDLNRVVDKPATTKPELPEDSRATTEEVSDLAKKCWESHCLRNDSAIQDLFTGMYKSTLVCPECDKVSITFDPFLNLTLPLPSSNVWMHHVTVLPLNGGILSLDVVLEPLDTVEDLKMQVQRLTGISGNLKVTDVWQHKIYNEFPDSALLAESIDKNDYLVAYEVPEDPVSVYIRVNKAYEGLPFFISSRSLLSTEIMHYPVISQLKKYADTGPVNALYVSSTETHELRLLDSPPSPSEVERMENNMPSPLDLSQSIECLSPPPPAQASQPASELPNTDETIGDGASSSSSSPISDISNSPECPRTSHEKSPEASSGQLKPGEGLVIDLASLKLHEPKVVSNPDADAARRNSQAGTSLDACVAKFSQPEVLGEYDLWYCSKCRDLRQARKQMQLWRVPDVIMIHLKRFSEGTARKVTDQVTFPLSGWDIGKHLGGNASAKGPVYDLFAVDNHYGGMGGGHYTSYVLNSADQQWYLYDDSRVTPVEDTRELESSAAYLLFYRRRSNSNLGKISDSFEEAIEASRAPKPEVHDTQDEEMPDESNNSSEDRFPGDGHKLGTTTPNVPKAPWASPSDHAVPASELSEQSSSTTPSPESSKSSMDY